MALEKFNLAQAAHVSGISGSVYACVEYFDILPYLLVLLPVTRQKAISVRRLRNMKVWGLVYV